MKTLDLGWSEVPLLPDKCICIYNRRMKKIFVLLAAFSLFSCVRAEKDMSTQVTLNLPSHFAHQTAIAPLSLNSGIVPASLSELNCFIVLVSGPEAGMSRNTCTYKNTTSTFPVGLKSKSIFRNAGDAASLSMDVPNGKNRALHLIGFKVDTSVGGGSYTSQYVCENFIGNDTLENLISEPYILAEQSEIQMSGDPITLDLTATLNSSYKVGDCKGPAFPNSGVGGSARIPSRFGISFQDGIGTAATYFGPSKCFAVRVQVQDSVGNRADMSANPTIIAKINTVQGSSIGTFYHLGGSQACAAGTEIIPVSSDITVAFNNGGTGFSDFLMYFAPSNAQGADGNLVARDGGSSIAMVQGVTAFSFDISGATRTPAKYAIYDTFNNKSTDSFLSTATRNIIKANQCRQATLQYMDSYHVPTMLNLSTGPYQSVSINSSVSTTFYSSSSDCTGGINGSSSWLAGMPSYSNYGGANFFYKVNVVSSNFYFTATNVGSGTPAILSADLTSGTNFWESTN